MDDLSPRVNQKTGIYPHAFSDNVVCKLMESTQYFIESVDTSSGGDHLAPPRPRQPLPTENPFMKPTEI